MVDERTDVQLLEATRDGEPAAFDNFYRRHREVILAYCARRAGPNEVAADLMAETFTAALVTVHERARPLPDVPFAWLIAVAQRKIIDSYRSGRVEERARQRLQLERLVLDDEDIRRIEEIATQTDLAREIAARLPADQYQALQARVVDERPYTEIAAELRCSEAVVRKRVSRALRTLRTVAGGAKS
jgi:RNA polymerase sigma factor (sigma-70 family)